MEIVIPPGDTKTVGMVSGRGFHAEFTIERGFHAEFTTDLPKDTRIYATGIAVHKELLDLDPSEFEPTLAAMLARARAYVGKQLQDGWFSVDQVEDYMAVLKNDNVPPALAAWLMDDTTLFRVIPHMRISTTPGGVTISAPKAPPVPYTGVFRLRAQAGVVSLVINDLVIKGMV